MKNNSANKYTLSVKMLLESKMWPAWGQAQRNGVSCQTVVTHELTVLSPGLARFIPSSVLYFPKAISSCQVSG